MYIIPTILSCLVLASPILGLILAIFLWFDSRKLELRKYESALSYATWILCIFAFFFWPVVLPWYIDIRWALKHGELPLKQTQKSDAAELVIRIICILALGFTPYFAYYLCYTLWPAYYVPFLNHPIARIVFIGLVWWQAQSFLLLLHAKALLNWLSHGVGAVLPLLVLLNIGALIVTLWGCLMSFDSKVISAEQAQQISALLLQVQKQDNISISISLLLVVLSLLLTFPEIWIRLLVKKRPANTESTAKVNPN